MKSIYLLATERSGSNLIRVMLGNHSKIAAPLPANCFRRSFENLMYYNNASRVEYGKIIEDIVSIVNHPFSQWDLKTTPEAIFEKYKPNSLVGSFSAVYSEYAYSQGKEAFFSKDIANIKFASLILQAEPGAKFIYLHRDPRDVVSSRVKGGIFANSVYQNAKFWKQEQEICISLQSEFPQNIHGVKYEDLISNTAVTVDGILDFLGLERETACYETGKSGSHARHEQSELWQNLAKPVIKNNSKKYKEHLSKKQVNIIESVAKNQMEYLGYTDFDTTADFKYKIRSWFFLQEQLEMPKRIIKMKTEANKKSKYMKEKMIFMNELILKRQNEWLKKNLSK